MVYVKFKDSEQVIPATILREGDNLVKIVTDTEPNTSGFNIFLHEDMTAPLDKGGYEEFTTLYRQLDGAYELSNDGSVWVEPTQTVLINIEWANVDEDARPKKVRVDIFVNGEKLDSINLTAKNNWQKEYTDVPMGDVYTVNAAAIEGMNMDISGTTIIYSMPMPYEPTVEEQLEELTDAVVDLDERVNELEGGTE